MPTAEELKARFEHRLRPGPTDERLAASLGLIAAMHEPLPMGGEEAGEVDAVQAQADPVATNGTMPDAEAAPEKGARVDGKARRKAVRLVSRDENGDEPAS